jgi:hypothetical protein
LRLNQWALPGDWTIGGKAARLNKAGGRLRSAFARATSISSWGRQTEASPFDFRVRIDGNPPGAAPGVGLDDRGDGTAADRRLYQHVRQSGVVDECTFEITFLESGGCRVGTSRR